jgi:hypothetical protein
MPKDRAGKKGGDAAGGKDKKNDKQRNPLIKEARGQYMQELRKQGMAKDQMKEKMRTHVKDVVKPAMSEARASAESQNLKGQEKKKFIENAVRTKLGMSSPQT